MNLYAYSQVNNEEIGIYFEKDTDEDAYLQCNEHLHDILDSTEVIKKYNEKDSEEENAIEITALSHRNILYFLEAMQNNYICSDIKAYRFSIDNKPNEYFCINNFPKKNINLYIHQSIINFDLYKIRHLMFDAHEKLLYRDIEFIINKYKKLINDYLYRNDNYYQFFWNGYMVNVYWTINKKNCSKALLHKKFRVLQQVSLIVQQAEIELNDYILNHSL